MYSLIEKLRPRIEQQEWVGRFGGLVRTAERIVPSFDGSKSVRQAFPISCNVNTRNCFETGDYLALVPDDSHKSVCYFEQLGDAKTEESQLLQCTKYVSYFRFVAWLNLPKMGVTSDCGSTSEKIMMEVCELLRCSYLGVSSDVSGLMSVEPVELGNHKSRIFEQYSYDEKQALLMPPYDFFSIVFKIEFDTQGFCGGKFVAMPPVLC